MVRFGVRYGAIAAGMTALVLTGCGGSKDKEAPIPTSEASAQVVGGAPAKQFGLNPGSETTATTSDSGAAKPVGFIPCMSCHSVTPGQNGIGPSLAGVFGRKAASAPGFSYSEAMKNSGKTWDEATLDTFLTNPMGTVPGTRMTYMGQSDPAKRKAVIEYLKTLK